MEEGRKIFERFYEDINSLHLHFEYLDSTQQYCIRNMKKFIEDNKLRDDNMIIVSCDKQYHGIGTRDTYKNEDRIWLSEEGNVFVTFLFLWNDNLIDKVKLLTQTCTVAISKTLESFYLVTQIKWINDVYVNYKKISGCLIHMYDRSLKNTYHNNNYNKNNHQNFSINKNNKNNKNFRNKNIQYNKTNMKQNKGNMNMNMNINMIDNNMMENNQENIKNIYNSGDNINVEHSYNGNNNDILNNMYYEENEKSDDYSSLSNNQNLVNKVANNRNVYENMRLINNTNNGNNSSMYNNTNNEDNNEINVYNNNMKSVYSNEDMDTFNDNNNILQNDDRSYD